MIVFTDAVVKANAASTGTISITFCLRLPTLEARLAFRQPLLSLLWQSKGLGLSHTGSEFHRDRATTDVADVADVVDIVDVGDIIDVTCGLERC